MGNVITLICKPCSCLLLQTLVSSASDPAVVTSGALIADYRTAGVEVAASCA